MNGAPLLLGGGFRLLRYAEVGSTNDLARGFAEEGEPEGLVVLADRQTAGRGRQGRTWQSPAGGNLYASLLLRPVRPMAEIPSLSLVVALSLADTVAAALPEGGPAVTVKWPNDVLVDGAKIGGILLEGASAGGERPLWVVAGIGVNLAWSPGDAAVGYRTTDLARLSGGTAPGPEPFLAALLGRLAADLGLWRASGFGGLRERWLARAFGVAADVTLRIGGETIRGRLRDVDADGAIRVLRADDGRVERFVAGELAAAVAATPG